MLKLPPISAQGASEALKACGRLDESSKKGLCWSELKRSGMSQWGVCRLVKFQPKNDDPQNFSSIVKEDEDLKDDGEAVTAQSPVIPEIRKRKCLTLSQLGEAKAARRAKVKKQNSNFPKSKKNKIEKSKERWSADRYKLAEQSMLQILKNEGAVFDNPISRPALRMAARKCIGDTGLLDHLLKHIDGKVAPGGTDRFRRCYNTEGVMEYWLESADLVKIKQEAGVSDPNYIPPSWWKTGGGPSQNSVCAQEIKLLKAETEKLKRYTEGVMEYCLENDDLVKIKQVAGISDPNYILPSWLKYGGRPSQDSVCAEELKLLKEEMEKMKRDMHEVMSKQPEKEQHNPNEEMHKELMKWKTKTDQCLMEISSSLSGMQDMFRELVKWKAKIEQQLIEISNSLSSMQSSKHCTTFSPSDPVGRWEDWLESTNLDDIQPEDFVPFFGSSDPVNVGGEVAVRDPNSAPQPPLKANDSPSQDPVCARELELPKEEMDKMKRDVQELVPNRQEEDNTNVTPDSSLTTNSKMDIDNSLIIFQVMLFDKLKIMIDASSIGDTHLWLLHLSSQQNPLGSGLIWQEMYKELMKWKAKMEEQQMEISNAVSAMQAGIKD